jgi:hypothetical protein
MNRRGIAIVSVLCVAVLALGVVDAKPKPEKPDEPNLTIECIVFMDNENDKDSDHVYLVGGQDCATVGCCPNAGPPAQFEMTLRNVWYWSALGTYELLDEVPVIGNVFMNQFGRNAPYEGWLVQFWTVYYPERRPVGGDFFFQVRGGMEVPQPRKSKVSVHEFLDADDATLWVYYDENLECNWFEDDFCEPCLNGVEPACDPRNDPECIYPCWIEQSLDNVSFRIVRTSNLDYTSGEYGVTCSATPCEFP